MAIERNQCGGNTQTFETEENLNRLKTILQHLTNLQDDSIDEKQIQEECNRVVYKLVLINVPTLAVSIKEFQSCLNSIGHCLENIIRLSSNPEQVFINCLQTLYLLLVKNGISTYILHKFILQLNNFNFQTSQQNHHRQEVELFLMFTTKILFLKLSNCWSKIPQTWVPTTTTTLKKLHKHYALGFELLVDFAI